MNELFILFGFAFVRDKKENSYIWVLENLLEAVEYKYPTSIITDQNIAIGNAIAKVFLKMKRTYCTCQISQRFLEKLSALYSN